MKRTEPRWFPVRLVVAIELETTVLPGPSMLFPRIEYTSDGVSWSLVAESTDSFLFGVLVHGRNRSGGVPVGNWTHYDW